MRVAAAVGGAVVYLLAAALWVAIVALSGHLSPNLVDLAVVGTAAVGILLCAVGRRGRGWPSAPGRVPAPC